MQLEPPVPRPWGEYRRLYFDRIVEVRELTILEGGYCSMHFHKDKQDTFIVKTGRILIRSGRFIGGPYQETTLGRGQRCSIWPPDVHQFEAMEASVVLEVTMSTSEKPVDLQDIHRLTQSGRRMSGQARNVDP